MDHIQEILLLGWLSLGYVVCFVSVYTLSCSLQCLLVILCLYARTISNFRPPPPIYYLK